MANVYQPSEVQKQSVNEEKVCVKHVTSSRNRMFIQLMTATFLRGRAD